MAQVEPGQMWVLRTPDCATDPVCELLELVGRGRQEQHVVMILQVRHTGRVADEEVIRSWWVLDSAGKRITIWDRTLRRYYRLLRPEAESGIERNHG